MGRLLLVVLCLGLVVMVSGRWVPPFPRPCPRLCQVRDDLGGCATHLLCLLSTASKNEFEKIDSTMAGRVRISRSADPVAISIDAPVLDCTGHCEVRDEQGKCVVDFNCARSA